MAGRDHRRGRLCRTLGRGAAPLVRWRHRWRPFGCGCGVLWRRRRGGGVAQPLYGRSRRHGGAGGDRSRGGRAPQQV